MCRPWFVPFFQNHKLTLFSELFSAKLSWNVQFQELRVLKRNLSSFLSFENEFASKNFRYLFVSLGLCWIFLLLLLWFTVGLVMAAAMLLWMLIVCLLSSDYDWFHFSVVLATVSAIVVTLILLWFLVKCIAGKLRTVIASIVFWWKISCDLHARGTSWIQSVLIPRIDKPEVISFPTTQQILWILALVLFV